jgi:hypothetical protein
LPQNRKIISIPACPFRRQTGLVLVLFVLVVTFVLGIAFIAGSSRSVRLLQLEKSARETLNQSRLAVIGISIGAISASARPGITIFPDVLSGAPGHYDGKAATGCFDSSKPNGLPLITTGSTMRCLGRLPWKDLGIQLDSVDEEDVLGNIPLFAISPNLVDPCLNVLNSNTASMTYTGYVCNGSTLPHPWLIVRDARGNVLSNRVAMVFIAPGSPTSGQVRNSYPNLGGANQYLDSVNIGGVGYSNADLDNDFIIGNQTDTFNDVVSYITIDDWLALVEERVGGELINSVASFTNPKSFRNVYSTLPWLVPFADPSSASNYLPAVNVTKGLLPVYAVGIDYPTSFKYRFDSTSGLTYSSTSISTAAMDSYVGTDRSVAANSGTCTWTTTGKRQASCKETVTTGLPGGVSKRIIEISVVALSNAKVSYALATATTLTTRTVVRTNSAANDPIFGPLFSVTDYNAVGGIVGSSSVAGGNATASVNGMVLPLNDILPNWFVENKWQEVIYAAIAPNFAPGASNVCAGACLTVGGRSDLQFVVLTAGPTLPALSQTRPSMQLSNYLDSTENSNADDKFTEKISLRTPTYNDQTFTYP